MDKKESLNVLYQAASQARLTSQEHDKVKEAAQVLLREIKPKTDEEENNKK